MYALPADTPVTVPYLLTFAIFLLLLEYVTVPAGIGVIYLERPVFLPFFRVTEVLEREITGFLTRILHLIVFVMLCPSTLPFALIVIQEVPFETARTTPFLLTVATDGLLLENVNVPSIPVSVGFSITLEYFVLETR